MDQVSLLLANALPYWLKGEEKQNFGDRLTDYFVEKLFYGVGLPAKVTYVIGSTMDDGLLERQIDTDLSMTGTRTTKTIFWGCGLRDENSLSPESQKRCTILSVRGQLSRSVLRLGADVPVGDPGLLLPALYKPTRNPAFAQREILVPHFNDKRTDEELIAISGCEVVVRPCISNSNVAIEEFVDQLSSATFVLSGALHGAIIAAAYGVPFAYWDSGDIDLPFKWRDFSASVEISCAFHQTIDAAKQFYESEIEEHLKLPPLLPMLSVAPFPVRQEAMVRVVETEIARHGIEALQNRGSLKVQSLLGKESWAVPSRLISAVLDQARFSEISARLGQSEKNCVELRDIVSSSQAELSRAALEIADLRASFSQISARLGQSEKNCVELRDIVSSSQAELSRAALEIADLTAKLDDREQTAAALKNQLSELNDQLLAALVGLDTALLFRARAEDLGSKLSELEALQVQTQAKLAEAERSQAQTRTKLAEAETSHAQTQAKLAEAEVSHAQTRARLAEVEASRTRLQSVKESVRAIGYIALPYNRRRREKRKALLKGLPYQGNIGKAIEGAASLGATPELVAPQKRSRIESIQRGLKAIGYITFPYNRRRSKKRKAMMASLRERI